MRSRKNLVIWGTALVALGALFFCLYATSEEPVRIARDQYIAGRRFITLRTARSRAGEYDFDTRTNPPVHLLIGGRWTEPEELHGPSFGELALVVPPEGGLCRADLIYRRAPPGPLAPVSILLRLGVAAERVGEVRDWLDKRHSKKGTSVEVRVPASLPKERIAQ